MSTKFCVDSSSFLSLNFRAQTDSMPLISDTERCSLETGSWSPDSSRTRSVIELKGMYLPCNLLNVYTKLSTRLKLNGQLNAHRFQCSLFSHDNSIIESDAQPLPMTLA